MGLNSHKSDAVQGRLASKLPILTSVCVLFRERYESVSQKVSSNYNRATHMHDCLIFCRFCVWGYLCTADVNVSHITRWTISFRWMSPFLQSLHVLSDGANCATDQMCQTRQGLNWIHCVKDHNIYLMKNVWFNTDCTMDWTMNTNIFPSSMIQQISTWFIVPTYLTVDIIQNYSSFMSCPCVKDGKNRSSYAGHFRQQYHPVGNDVIIWIYAVIRRTL